MNESRMLEPQRIWQNQRTEQREVALADLRLRASVAQLKVRRNLFVSIGLITLLFALCMVTLGAVSMAPVRMIAGAMMVLVTLIAVNAYQRFSETRTLRQNAGEHACLRFYRRVLLAQYRSLSLRWHLVIPCVVFLWLTWRLIDVRSSHFVMRTLLPASLAVTILMRRREVTKLKRELASVSAFEQENGR